MSSNCGNGGKRKGKQNFGRSELNDVPNSRVVHEQGWYFSSNTAYAQSMQQKTVTFRAPGDKIKALDSLAALQQRDRSFVLNEAVDQYLSLNEYHVALINEGLRQADAGELVPHEEVRRRLASLMKPESARKLKKKTK